MTAEEGISAAAISYRERAVRAGAIDHSQLRLSRTEDDGRVTWTVFWTEGECGGSFDERFAFDGDVAAYAEYMLFDFCRRSVSLLGGLPEKFDKYVIKVR